MTMKQIRMDLARDRDFPQGSRQHGYVLVAPLDNMDRIDAAEWKANREQCRVTRFWGDNEHEIGHLVRKPGGAWAFHYDIHGNEDDDETGYRFGDERFRPGEYVSIREQDGEMRTFRVITATDIR
ncbi:hypothetical protein [Anderseniella sp. Alg231-50]|uniref:hypothetical protein n=1 Tax=Anderseniella sp. Alg231-50 TaxID=1922226 RepID=UPI000D555676